MNPGTASTAPSSPKLLEQIANACRIRHDSPSTAKTYQYWAKHFILYGRRQAGRFVHPRQLGAAEIEAYLNHLAKERRVAAATQNQALNAIVFLYKHVLKQDPGRFNATRAKRPKNVPTVMTRDETAALIDRPPPPVKLVAQVMYGGGLRVGEACALRVKDVDTRRQQVTIRRGKGAKDRVTLLPASLIRSLQNHIERRHRLHREDLRQGEGWVELPTAFARKSPRSAWSFPWQFLFPAYRLSRHPDTGQSGRWHIHEATVQSAIKRAAEEIGLTKRVTSHTLRHSFATPSPPTSSKTDTTSAPSKNYWATPASRPR